MAFIGNLIPSVELVQGSAKYTVKIGDTFDSLTYYTFSHGNVNVGVGEPVDYTDKEVKLEKAKVVGIELGNPRSYNNGDMILDTVPTYMYRTDDKADIRHAAAYYNVPYLLVETTEGEGDDAKTAYTRIPVSKIKELAGTFNEGGSETKTTGVDLSQDDASAAAAITEAGKGDTVALSSGTVDEPLNVDKDVTVTGSNAGIPQNFKQEV